MTETVRRNRIFSLLGLAARGRNVVSGEFMTEKSVKGKKAFLVIVSEEASENTKKMFYNMCEFYHTPYTVFGGKEELGHAIGKEQRASLAVINEGIADSIQKLLDGETKESDR